MTIDIPSSSVAPLIKTERVAELDARWNHALQYLADTLYPSAPPHKGTLSTTLAYESQANFTRHPDTQLLIGIAGPGAAGKGTLGRYLSGELGFDKVINTTTREKREGEIHGIDYFFVDHTQFTTTQNLGQFALALERLGRGWYGISQEEITHKLSTATGGCIFEENPENIMKLFANVDDPAVQAVLLYVLPQQPVMQNSLLHLQHRLSLEQDPAKQILTPEIFESTLGDRQIDEFLALAALPGHPAITPIFVVNDDLEETEATLTTMFGGTRVAA